MRMRRLFASSATAAEGAIVRRESLAPGRAPRFERGRRRENHLGRTRLYCCHSGGVIAREHYHDACGTDSFRLETPARRCIYHHILLRERRERSTYRTALAPARRLARPPPSPPEGPPAFSEIASRSSKKRAPVTSVLVGRERAPFRRRASSRRRREEKIKNQISGERRKVLFRTPLPFISRLTSRWALCS